MVHLIELKQPAEGIEINMIKNRKLKTKLLIGFGFIMMIFIISLLFSLNNLYSANHTLEKIERKSMVNTELIADIRINLLGMQKSIYQAVTTMSNDDTEKNIEESKAYMVAAENAIGDLQNNYIDNQQLFSEINDLMMQSEQYHDEIMNDLMVGMDTGRTSALDILKNKQGPLFVQIADQLKSLSVTIQNEAHYDVLQAQAKTSNAIVLIVVFFVVGASFSVIIGIIITRGITKPVKELMTVAGNLKNGLLNTEIKYDAKDEMGTLANEFRATLKTLNEYITDISNVLHEMANGNFNVSLSQSFEGDFKKIEISMSKFIVDITEALSQINSASDQVSSGSGQIANAAQLLADGATCQANTISELSNRINEISTQVTENAQNAITATQMSKNVTAAILNSNSQMQTLLTAMNDINDNSKEIEKIVKTIEDIAFQSNILALNASVEAARAGSAGKGFSVVAEEVRSLAGRSAKAAKNTTFLIESSTSAVAIGVSLAEQTASNLSRVVESIESTTEAVSRIAEASKDQSKAISEVSKGIVQISTVTENNSATSEESAAASNELSDQAYVMKELVGRFQIRHQVEESNCFFLDE